MNTNSQESENREMQQFEKMYFVHDGIRPDGHLDGFISNIRPTQLITITKRGVEIYEFEYKSEPDLKNLSILDNSGGTLANTSTNINPTSKIDINGWTSTLKLQLRPELSLMSNQPSFIAKIKTSTDPNFLPHAKSFTCIAHLGFVTTFDDDKRIDCFDLTDPFKKAYSHILFRDASISISPPVNSSISAAAASASPSTSTSLESKRNGNGNVNATVSDNNGSTAGQSATSSSLLSSSKRNIVNLISRANLLVSVGENKIYAYMGGHQDIYNEKTYQNPNGICSIIHDPTDSLSYYLCFLGNDLGTVRLTHISYNQPQIIVKSAAFLVFSGEGVSQIAMDNFAQSIAITNQSGTTIKIVNMQELVKLFSNNANDGDYRDKSATNTSNTTTAATTKPIIEDSKTTSHNNLKIDIKIQHEILVDNQNAIPNSSVYRKKNNHNNNNNYARKSRKVTATRQFPYVFQDYAKKLFTHQFKRGRNHAEIYSLTFNKTGKHLLCSSNRGKIHVFSLDPNTPNQSLFKSLPFLSSMISSDQWSFASFQVDSQKRHIACFGDELNTIHVVTENNLFYTLKYMMGKIVQGPVFILKSSLPSPPNPYSYPFLNSSLSSSSSSSSSTFATTNSINTDSNTLPISLSPSSSSSSVSSSIPSSGNSNNSKAGQINKNKLGTSTSPTTTFGTGSPIRTSLSSSLQTKKNSPGKKLSTSTSPSRSHR